MFLPPPLPRNVDAAFRDLSSKKPDIRAGAARDVVRHALAAPELRERAVQRLVTALSDPAPAVRSAAALGLGELDATEALPQLLVRVEDDEQHVRQMALTALGELGDARALPRLRRALTDARPEVRYQAVIAIGRVAPAEEVGTALASSLDDADDAVRYIALRIGEERYVGEGQEAGDRAPFAPLLDKARERLKDKTPRVSAAAAILLARGGDEGGRAFILRLVRGEVTADKEDEQEAVELAGELDLREALPALERRAYGTARIFRDTCAFHAKIALARLGHERAREEIRRDLGARRIDVRSAAVVAAGRARLVELEGAIRGLGEREVDPRLRDEALALLGKGAA